MSNPIRVFITDDHSIVRKGIRATLELIPDIELVGEAANGREAVEMVARLKDTTHGLQTGRCQRYSAQHETGS